MTKLEWPARGYSIGARSSLGDLYEVSQLSENVWITFKNGVAFPGWQTTKDAAQACAQKDYDERAGIIQ